MIPDDKIQDFFFMNDEDQAQEYDMSAALTMSGMILKDRQQDKVYNNNTCIHSLLSITGL